MIFLIPFVLFFGTLLFLLIKGVSIIYALFVGIVAFSLVGVWKGTKWKAIGKEALIEIKKLYKLLFIFLLIGTLTGLWRSCGTIATCIYYSVPYISSRFFYVTVYLITSAVSYMLGTSFGVSGTAGVIFMTLGRASGAYEPLLAGTILAAVYFGDRCSPASSSAFLVAAVTGTDLYKNVKNMLRTGLSAYVLTAVIYLVLGILNPVSTVDRSLLSAFEGLFSMGWITILPALLMLVLPILKLPIRASIGISAFSAFCISVFYQHMSLLDALKTAVFGYSLEDSVMGPILSGGGVSSMVLAAAMVMSTGVLTGVLRSIGVLNPVCALAEKCAGKVGRYLTCLMLSFLSAAVFCNQTICSVVAGEVLGGLYGEEHKEEFAIDLENTGIVVAPLLPWNISVSVPLVMLGASSKACLFEFFLMLLPIIYYFTKPRYFKE